MYEHSAFLGLGVQINMRLHLTPVLIDVLHSREFSLQKISPDEPEPHVHQQAIMPQIASDRFPRVNGMRGQKERLLEKSVRSLLLQMPGSSPVLEKQKGKSYRHEF